MSTKRSAPKAATMLLPRLRIDPLIIESSEESTTKQIYQSSNRQYFELTGVTDVVADLKVSKSRDATWSQPIQGDGIEMLEL